jgi:hypothetical protein
MSNSTAHLFPKINAQENSFETGQLFEKYIIQLFNQRFFTVQKWRKSELYPPGQMPSGHSGPDLEMILFGLRSNRFAVECKWRTQFYDDKLQWAEPHQLIRYQRFRESRRIPFFVAIGVGGDQLIQMNYLLPLWIILATKS